MSRKNTDLVKGVYLKMQTCDLVTSEINAIELVKNIGRNMKDYNEVKGTACENHFNINDELFNPWETLSLSRGIPGLCMLYAELHSHFPNEGWDEIGHQYLFRLVKEIEVLGIKTPSLFSGAAGIGLATVCLSQDFKMYQKFIGRINEFLISTVPKKIADCSSRDLYMIDYDVIEGVSGIVNYLLLLPEEERINHLLNDALKFLVSVTNDIERHNLKVPGWYIPSEHHFTEIEKELYPKGSFNLGLAHGISGIVIVLSKASLRGKVVDGQKQAIKKMVKFLIQFANKNENVLFWKNVISFEEFQEGKASNHIDFKRDAWCYGTPGVCLSLIYAGKALEDTKYIHLAIESLTESVKSLDGIFSPTFCHGYAGIIQILVSANEIIGQEYFDEQIKDLKNKMLSYYEPDYLYGFHSQESFLGHGQIPVNYMGLLDGTVGVCLTLLGINLAVKTKWREALVL